MSIRRALPACLLLLATSTAHADNWDGFATFMAEFVIALPWSLLFLSINIAWVIRHHNAGKGMIVLALLTMLGPLAVIVIAWHDLHDAGPFSTIAAVNGIGVAIALLPLAIRALRTAKEKHRALHGPVLSDLLGRDPDITATPSPGSTWLAPVLGWILLATGVAIGCFILRWGILGYLWGQGSWEAFDTIFVAAELVAFATPPTIVGIALIRRSPHDNANRG